MDNITKKPTRKGYSSRVKFQAVMDVIRGKPVGEVARLYGFHPTLFPRWKKQGIIINHKKLLSLLKKWGLNLKRSIVKKFKGSF